jgi:hypothetical protein
MTGRTGAEGRHGAQCTCEDMAAAATAYHKQNVHAVDNHHQLASPFASACTHSRRSSARQAGAIYTRHACRQLDVGRRKAGAIHAGGYQGSVQLLHDHS